MQPRAMRLYAHTTPGKRPRALFVVHHGARALAELALIPEFARAAEAALEIARERTRLGLCARCEHILPASDRIAIDVRHELAYCLGCWSALGARHAADI